MKLSIKHGNEGPRHDPYGYTEISVESTDGSTLWIFHLGLNEWAKKNNRELLILQTPFPSSTSNLLISEVEAVFFQEVGFPLSKASKYLAHIRSICSRCLRRTRFIEHAGHPGETVFMCSVCESIVFSEQDYSAII